jgi:hypothetical protein
MDLFKRRVIDPLQRTIDKGNPIDRLGAIQEKAIDSIDVFKKLKQRDQKKMAGLNRQMAESDMAMEKARNKNEFLLRQVLK